MISFIPVSCEKESRSQALTKLSPLRTARFIVHLLFFRFPSRVILVFSTISFLYFSSSIIDIRCSLLLLFLLAASFVTKFVLKVKSGITTEFDWDVSIKELECYKDERLMKVASEMEVVQSYRWPNYYHQPREGYCGHATVNSVLWSIPGSTKIMKLPSSPAGIGLHEMGKSLQRLLALGSDFDPAISKIKNITVLDSFPTFQSFQKQLVLVNNPRYRFLANFLRGPLFYCDPKDNWSYFRRLLGGHWSPLAAYVSSPLSTLEGKSRKKGVKGEGGKGMSDGFVLVLDVNPKYGHYFVPAERMYKAVRTKDVLGSGWRGLIRVELE